jgi:serine/threonine-protein kinase
MFCPSCGASRAPAARFCERCGAALVGPPAPTAAAPQDATVLSGGHADETRMSTAPSSRAKTPTVTSGSGWLSSTADIDHGRFTPGAIVGDRYRIMGLLGRGGMGEVFRADDLRLGQPVALKFLPATVEHDPIRLAQFHNEVRTARQVSHPNVCRVYDIGEIEGQHFLTMEFIDGEDLSSLLRRIGRLPEDKAIEIARQICAGLHAAHERGLLHRDLKPANVMLDREGRVRITDFSLAAVAGTVEDIRAGTPAYMAPEQLAGREVTARSDLYALGLVLYELFTGKRALDAKTIADLIDRQASGAITLPTDLVTSLDPVIERSIMRCLEADPARRPASALAVAASLPGGDPLAAALAAGETPSPEMVAAAGSESAAVTPLAGLAWLVAALVMLASIAVLDDKVMLPSRTPFDRSAEVLLDRARTFEREIGLGASVLDDAHGFGYAQDYVRWLERTRPGADRFAPIGAARPPTLLYWYRSSPRLLVAGDGRGGVGFSDPALTVTGMVNMVFGADGTLYEFHLVPAQVESQAPAAPAPVDWPTFFALAGFDFSRFQPAAPDWTPRSFADARMAWTGTLAEMPDVPVRIDAASHRGWPVYFQFSGPWARATRMEAAGNRGRVAAVIANAVIAPALIFGAAYFARRNLKRGRGDRRGAARAGVFILAVNLTAWLFRAHHLPDANLEIAQFFGSFAYDALFQGALFWIFYLAIEPQVRRVWPRILITWSRLLGGSLRDPLVGRDLLIGTAAGLVLTLITLAYQYAPVLAGLPAFAPTAPDLTVALGWPDLIASLLRRISNSVQNGAMGVLGLVLMRMLLRRTWLAFVAGCLMFGSMAAQGQFESAYPLVDYAFGVMLCVVLLLVALRYGLFATVVAFMAHFTTLGIAATLDASRVHFVSGAVALTLVGLMAAAGFYLARAGEPLFGRVLAEE